MKPKLLMIVNEFPPVGESGVQRPLKFLKYLDRAGWETFVITPKRPAKTVLDHSLCQDIPPRTKIYRTWSLGFTGRAVDTVAELRHGTARRPEPGRKLLWKALSSLNHILFPLDKQIGWVPFALLISLRLLRRHQIKNVYITAFPYSAFIIGILLKKLLGKRIRWIADYRDAWQFEPLLQENLPALRKRVIRFWDEQTLKTCDQAVFVTDYIRERYLKAYPWLQDKATTITNGYDEDDFQGLAPKHFDRFTFVYMGKFYNLQRPDPRPLFNALQASTLQDFQLVHIGTISPDVREAISSFKFYSYQGYKPHREALAFGLGASVNLLLINDDTESAGVYTGKVFELLRLGRPILALGPKNSVVKQLIETSGAGVYAHLGDETAITSAIEQLCGALDQYQADQTMITAFSRERLCEQLIRLYD